ncbi:MAG: DUF2235 domain-containing protein [Acidobacteriaceae bacterium]
MRNIVICCDGTGNEYCDANSNVVKLYHAMEQSAQQVVYYHPGVGTMGAQQSLTAAGKTWTKWLGLGFGYGLSENIADAYGFLMQNYQPEDRVFVFGFSRGAYTARALCGLLEMCGLVRPGNEGQIPYALRLFKRQRGRFDAVRGVPSKFYIAKGFKATFSVECNPYFAGLWDTVSSVGWFLDLSGLKKGSMPHTTKLDQVNVVRHAVLLDERRSFFRQNLVDAMDCPGDPKRDLKQVWFAGVHSDVGGSYPEAEAGLANITLRWMLKEAEAAGLKLVPGQKWALLGGSLYHARARHTAMLHKSLHGPLWSLAEFWPKAVKRLLSAPCVKPAVYKGSLRANLFRRRVVPEGATIHESVLKRKAALKEYTAPNLPAQYVPAPDLETDPEQIRLNVGDTMKFGIFALLRWNDTALHVLKGESYTFTADGKWYDATIKSDANGYTSKLWRHRLTARFRRSPRGNWFLLMGALSMDDRKAFAIGTGPTTHTATEDGKLFCFANDLWWFYFNNSGLMKLTVERIS